MRKTFIFYNDLYPITKKNLKVVSNLKTLVLIKTLCKQGAPIETYLEILFHKKC